MPSRWSCPLVLHRGWLQVEVNSFSWRSPAASGADTSLAAGNNCKLSTACLTDMGMVEWAAGQVSLLISKTLILASIPGYCLAGFLCSLFLFTTCGSLCLLHLPGPQKLPFPQHLHYLLKSVCQLCSIW